MKIVCSKEALVKALQLTLPIATGKATLPILANVLLQTEENKLKIAASDLETSVSFYIKAEIVESGAITVPAKKFFDIIKEVISENIEIKNTEGTLVNIKAGKSKFSLNGLTKDDYPLINEFSFKDCLALNVATIVDMFTKTIYSVSKDAQRYVLNGVYIKFSQNRIETVGTDGKRLACISNVIANPQTEYSAIIPTKAIADIIKILTSGIGTDQTLYFALNEKQIAIKHDDITFFAAIIDGTFPKYEQILPQPYTELKSVKINATQLLTAVKQAALFTLANVGIASPVKLTFDKNNLTVSANSSTIGSGEVEMDVEFSNKKITLLFNPQYLKDVLQNIECENVILHYLTETNPTYFVPEKNPQYINVVMPIRG